MSNELYPMSVGRDVGSLQASVLALRVLILIPLLLSAVACLAAETVDPPADLVLINGKVFTVDSSQPWAEAVAIRQGEIVAVGTDEQVLAQAGTDTQITHLGGRMVLPGMIDSHVHAVEAGVNENLCFFPPELTLAEYEDVAIDCYFEQKSEPWVLGAGVFLPDLLESEELPIDVLDRAIPDRPAFILDDLGHGGWANSLAMEAAGYGPDSLDPQGGILDRDPDTGRLTGVVFENAQQKLRDAALPPTAANRERAYQGLLESLAELNRNGITSVSDAGGYWTRGHHEVWQRAESEGKLTVRASNALYVFPDRAFASQISDLKSLFSNDPSRRLRFNQAKIYVDGILDLGTSALIEPYLDIPSPPSPSPLGFEYFPPTELQGYVRELEALGFQIHFHATGDRGARLALDAVEAAQGVNGIEDRRHRITHLYLVDSQDRGRFDSLGVFADLQMSPNSISAPYSEFLETFLGQQRVSGLLPAKGLLDAGASVVLSSDWDAGPLSPFGTIERALTRFSDPIGQLDQAIRMQTLEAAKLLHQDETTGSIEVGKRADLIVIDRNLFEVERSEIGETEVLATFIDGELVHTTGEIADSCRPTDTVLCLQDQRFRLEVSHRNFEDQIGVGRILPAESDDSGLLYFFSPDNWEMLVKVLDGCALNQKFWVFAASTTNVEYTLSVTDTLTGQVKTYFNELGVSAPAVTDTQAFSTCR